MKISECDHTNEAISTKPSIILNSNPIVTNNTVKYSRDQTRRIILTNIKYDNVNEIWRNKNIKAGQ